MKSPYIYVRGLRHAEHTVFCVDKSQKTYWDPSSGRNIEVAYSSGQQVKRSILLKVIEALGIQEAPVRFNFAVNEKKKSISNAEPWSACDPTYPDQLLGGWMRAEEGKKTIKRRSPLSISAMRPIHPLLANTNTEDVTFDRSSNPNRHEVKIRDKSGEEISLDEAIDLLEGEEVRELSPRTWIGDALKTTTGLYVYDVAIDLRRLFCVSLSDIERELTEEVTDKLKEAGWVESENFFGPCLVCPEDQREKIIEALAEGLINWQITSNQARTFSLMEPIAFALSDKAHIIAGAIRAELKEDVDKDQAVPRVDEDAGADVFKTLPISGYIKGEYGSADAVQRTKQWLADRLQSFDYENQISVTAS